MTISSLTSGLQAPPLLEQFSTGPTTAPAKLTNPTVTKGGDAEGGELREAFDQFVGETFYGQLLASMRKTVNKPAYFHGGRAEEVFQGQMDQILAEKMSETSASDFTGPMFELFNLNRK